MVSAIWQKIPEREILIYTSNLCLLFEFQNWILFTVALSQKQVDRHLRKLDQELAKFKMELEADNAGITEILERRKYT